MKCTQIFLDGTIASDLNWDVQFERVEGKVLWGLDLGLFSKLKRPLSDQQQFLSLQLSVEHFSNKVEENNYFDQTVGVVLYQGPAESLRRQEIEYLELLASSLPYPIEPVLLLDLSRYKSPVEVLEAIHPEPFRRFLLGGKTSFCVRGDFIWEKGVFLPTPPVQTAICLPGIDQGVRRYSSLLHFLERKREVYRLIDEGELHAKWEGVHTLYIDSKSLHPSTRRQLIGFAITGGKVITQGDLLGLPGEEAFCTPGP